ncbi:MAG: hypothetical protein VB061_13080 [Christensenella sp.]|nr:hypothetical protein [Christensenella sp.]
MKETINSKKANGLLALHYWAAGSGKRSVQHQRYIMLLRGSNTVTCFRNNVAHKRMTQENSPDQAV